MTHHEIITRVRTYVSENFLYMRQGFEFADTDSLLGRGIIDSMGVVELITFLQDEFNVAVEDGDITEENFGTLDAIGRYVHDRRAGHLVA